MPTSFDPYYKWLGIPREEQPPNLYRLLGLRAFESDPDVISNAADQRMALLKTFAIGTHRELSESLLNEVARARVWLLNPVKKSSYDTKLRETIAQPTSSLSPQPRMESVTAHSTHWVGEAESEFKHVILAGTPSVAITRRRRKTSSGSGISIIITAIITGFFGLSAGYLVLCVINIRYDFLHLMHVEKPSESHTFVSREPPKIPESSPIAPRGPRPPQNVPRPKNRPGLPPGRILPPVQPALPPLQSAPPLDQPTPPPNQPALPPASALVLLQFDKPVIRIVATPVEIELRDVLCDIAINPQLMRNAMMGNPEDLQIVYAGLKIRDKKTHEIPLNIESAGAALEVSIVQRSNSIVCEIRPKFSLPVNGIEELTKDRGTELHNKLTAQLRNIETFRRDRSAISEEMAQRRRDASDAQSALNSGNLNPSGANNARAAITRAQRAIGTLQKRIDNGKALQRDESAIKTELDALNRIDTYAKNVSGIAQVYIRFYNGDVTVPAVVK